MGGKFKVMLHLDVFFHVFISFEFPVLGAVLFSKFEKAGNFKIISPIPYSIKYNSGLIHIKAVSTSVPLFNKSFTWTRIPSLQGIPEEKIWLSSHLC